MRQKSESGKPPAEQVIKDIWLSCFARPETRRRADSRRRSRLRIVTCVR